MNAFKTANKGTAEAIKHYWWETYKVETSVKQITGPYFEVIPDPVTARQFANDWRMINEAFVAGRLSTMR
jgi:hypothetical protein